MFDETTGYSLEWIFIKKNIASKISANILNHQNELEYNIYTQCIEELWGI